MKKQIVVLSVIVLALVVVIGGVVTYLEFGKGGVDDVSETSEDGFVTIDATFYDFSGDEVGGGVQQALIGGTSKRTHVKFAISITNTGNVPLTNIRTTSANANMNGAFDNVQPLANLNVGAGGIPYGSTDQVCTSDTDCDSNEECKGTPQKCYVALDNYITGNSGTQHNVDFTIRLMGDYLDAIGNPQTVTSDPVTLTYDIRGETCTDGTTINTCVFDRTSVDTDKPKYCSFTEGTAPQIINKASICGCPSGYHANGETCVLDTCADGTPVGSCSTTTAESTYGAYMYCKPDLTFEARCNQCGCTDDAYNNPAIGCLSASDPSSCEFQSYTGGLSGSIGE